VTYKRWDVVSIHFPFVEGTDSKRRPGLVISADRLYAEHGLYWVAMITTAKSGPRKGDIAVTDLDRAGLPENCVIRVPRVTVVGNAQIARRLGDIAPKDRNAVSALIHQFAP
jgi:mRNA-degrading endonuclease toxin of MazEF toxin-antitoxin module